MRLSDYPFVLVRIGCTRCSRRGQYRLARLADRYGSEVPLLRLLDQLAADCTMRGARHPNVFDRCGAHFVDLSSTRPPDLPVAMIRLRVVR